MGVHNGGAWVRAEGLVVKYGNETIVEESSFEVKGPGLVAVLGPNGSGKTTLFRTLLGLIRPAAGRVWLMGEEVTGSPEAAGRHAGYVPQLVNVAIDFPVTAREFVCASIMLRRRPPRLRTGCEARRLAEKYLGMVGALEYADRPVNRLSGGQLQRVFIARALAREPSVLVMDEPLSGIDPRGRDDIVGLISRLSRDRLVLVSTHDPVLFLGRAKEFMVVNRGVRAAGPPEKILRYDTIREIFGGSVFLVEKCVHIAHE